MARRMAGLSAESAVVGDRDESDVSRVNDDDRWGRWVVIEKTDKAVTLQCSCGVTRTIDLGFWTRRRWRLSVKCRKCSNELESQRNSIYLFGKDPLPRRISR